MKRTLLLKFADYLESSRTPFSLDSVAKCINAHALHFENNRLSVRRGECYSSQEELSRIFDLDAYTARQLYAPGTFQNWKPITRKVAAEVVRKLARTGDVDYVGVLTRKFGVDTKVLIAG